ncbi:MAG: LUD domain-containing protein [Candidatus Saccharibacteria bacterium]
MKDYSKAVSKEEIKKAIKSLQSHGIGAELFETSEAATQKIVHIVPKDAEVFTMSSATLDESGLADIFNSDAYSSVRNNLMTLDREKDSKKMRKLGTAPDYAIGSVHAITQDGKLVIVSNTGSQLPAYAYGAEKVIFVVGAQKIVKDLPEAMERIEKYTLPLESKRVQKAYGMPESAIRKWLIIDSEIDPQRIQVLIINQNIGY